MNVIILLIFFLILFVLELIYFKIANKYNIIDHPNHRSSHTKVTIRGGGIIFSLSLLIGSFYIGLEYIYFLVGLFLISIVSFIDDIKPTSRRIRILFHLIAVALLFQQLEMHDLSIYWIAFSFILVIGTINAVNFMDGINGITGSYAIVSLFTLYYINRYLVPFTNENYIILPILALLVFNFFNFRARAKCFAGDVGSVSIAFIILFFLLQLIIKTKDINYLFLLIIYGLDTFTTILFRMLRKENIFEPHRSHFYQFLVNEKKIPHLWIAALYALIQGIVNILLLSFLPKSIVTLVLVLITTMSAFIFIRLNIEGRERLLNVKG